jgi:hypothetical protein
LKSIPGFLIGSFLLVGLFGSANAPTVAVDPQESPESPDETIVSSLSPSPRDAAGDVAGDDDDALVALTLGDDLESQSALAWAANGDQSGTPGVVSFADGLDGSPHPFLAHPFLALSAGDLSSGALGGGGGDGAADAAEGRLAGAGGFGFGGSGFGGGSGSGGSGGSGSGGSDSPTQESLPPGDTLVETPRAVPEPTTTFLLCAAGLGALAYLRAHRRGSLARLTS